MRMSFLILLFELLYLEKPAAFEDVDIGCGEFGVELVQEHDVVLDLGEFFQDLVISDKAAILALQDEFGGFDLEFFIFGLSAFRNRP